MQLMNSFIIYFLTFSSFVVVIYSKRLRRCAEREYYKTEYRLVVGEYDYEKLNTTIRCKCNADRRRPDLTKTKHPTENNMWIWNYRCFKAPKKQLKTCFEHQICKRQYYYNFGRYRIREQYVDTTEIYCNCEDELECEEIGFIPKFMIGSYDNILSYRCTPYIYEYNELKPCERNQIYLTEIFRYVSYNGPQNHKLNTYIKCICETNKWTINQTGAEVDKANEIQTVRVYECPWSSRPSVEASCKDYAICRRGYETDYGAEKPDEWLTYYYTTYCRCDQGRECVNVGKIGNETIHRCYNNKGSDMRKNCKYGEIYRVDIHKKYSVAENGTAKDIEIKLNTIQMCICTGNSIRMENDTGSYDKNEYVTKYRCQVNATLKETELSYCFKNEVCRINVIEQMGSERGDSTFRKTSIDTCICSFPRACMKAEEPNFSSGIDRCTLSNETKNELEPCGYGEFYKDVIYTNLTDSKGNHKRPRMNTIFMCKCDHILYDEYEDIMDFSNDPRDRNRTIESYICPRPKNTTKELQSCENNEKCSSNVFEHYGEDVGPHTTYLLSSFTYCKCDGERFCTISKKEDPGEGNAIVNTFQCVKEAPCMEDELCRISEYDGYGSKELVRNTRPCHCLGECSYRPVNSIIYSWKYKTETHYYTCKFPSSA